MIAACRTFITARLQEMRLPDGITAPYREADPGKNIFFDELPLDFLKDNDYAVCCLQLQDRSKPYGKLIAKNRTLGAQPAYALTRRRFTREVIFRCMIYAPTAELLWEEVAYTGLVEQFNQAIAGHKVIADVDNSAIRIEPQDSARPWDTGVELGRKLRRPRLAIVRVLFSGGIQTTETQPIIPDITFVPQVS